MFFETAQLARWHANKSFLFYKGFNSLPTQRSSRVVATNLIMIKIIPFFFFGKIHFSILPKHSLNAIICLF